ncbi:hypothetical protein ACWDUL_33605 [Nocardia niigatensis]
MTVRPPAANWPWPKDHDWNAREAMASRIATGHRCPQCGRAEDAEHRAARERRNREQYSRWVLGNDAFAAWHHAVNPDLRARVEAEVAELCCADPGRVCGGAEDRTYWYWEQMLRVYSTGTYRGEAVGPTAKDPGSARQPSDPD